MAECRRTSFLFVLESQFLMKRQHKKHYSTASLKKPEIHCSKTNCLSELPWGTGTLIPHLRADHLFSKCTYLASGEGVSQISPPALRHRPSAVVTMNLVSASPVQRLLARQWRAR